MTMTDALALVRLGVREVTFDVVDLSQSERHALIAAAKARGLHVSGTSRWLLVRELPEGVRAKATSWCAGFDSQPWPRALER